MLLVVEGEGNKLQADYPVPIRLNPLHKYTLAVMGFYGCNSIKNIHEGHDKLYYKNDKDGTEHVITIPHGSYEIDQLSAYLESQIQPPFSFRLTANNNTQKCEFKSTYTVDFSKPDSIGRMLGFKPHEYTANAQHISELDIQIIKHTNVYVECNIVKDSYRNNLPAHILYGFSISVSPGFRMDSIPTTPIYLDVNVETIYNLEIRLVNQKDDLIDFGNEQASVILELKDNGSKF